MSENTQRKLFGTLGGVFTPSILTILGVIMFLRSGYVIGQAGIFNTIVILLIAEAITLLTAISMSTIATNTPVEGGGAYFLISRTLGGEFGGSIGMALYLAQALSVPFYILGFTAALTSNFPAAAPWFTAIALGTAFLLFALNLIGTSWAIKSQYFVMTLLGLSIISFLGGGILHFSPATFFENMTASYSEGISFWVIFAIYFPCVTGILAGVNMSGDLKDPSKSLVRGTLAAIAVGFVVYLAQAIISGGSQVRVDLVGKPYEMLVTNALFGTGYLVVAGVFAATLSSALGSFLGAPRVMQAVARDRILPGLSPFGRGAGENDEPRTALWLTLLITVAVILFASGKDALKSFDAIAAIVAMFFLCTYGMINLAAFVEAFGGNPSFRPRFKFYHWGVSLFGAASCLAVMLRIDAIAAVIAAIVITVLYFVIRTRMLRSKFGDARRGFLFSIIARDLLRLEAMPPDPKNWRPVFLVLMEATEESLPLVQYADWMEGGRGIVTAAQVLAGDFDSFITRRDTALKNLNDFIRENHLNVFPEVVVSEDLDEGLRLLIQAHSIGPIKPNTVVFGWPQNPERIAPYVSHLRTAKILGKNIISVIARGVPAAEKKRERTIDIWWRGKENGSLMMILAHLLTANLGWRHTTIRVVRVVPDEAARKPAHEALTQLVESGRFDAEPQILVSDRPFEEVLHRHSRRADLIFMGMPIPEEGDEESFVARINELIDDKMPAAILVNSTGEADLLA